MKNLKTITLIFCAVFTLASCETEEIQEPVSAAKIKTTINKSGGGNAGGEEEDPIIIYGLTQNSSNDTIENGEVNLYDALTNELISTDDTDSNGNFEFSELSGNYYVIIHASGYLTFQSADLDFPLNNGVVFTLQEE